MKKQVKEIKNKIIRRLSNNNESNDDDVPLPPSPARPNHRSQETHPRPRPPPPRPPQPQTAAATAAATTLRPKRVTIAAADRGRDESTHDHDDHAESKTTISSPPRREQNSSRTSPIISEDNSSIALDDSARSDNVSLEIDDLSLGGEGGGGGGTGESSQQKEQQPRTKHQKRNRSSLVAEDLTEWKTVVERHTVGGEDVSSRSESGWNTRRSSSIMNYPEVEMIVEELNKRLETLESMMDKVSIQSRQEAAPATSTSPMASFASAAPSTTAAAAQDPPSSQSQPSVTITVSPSQQSAITGLSSNIRGLLRCLSHRHNEQMDKVLIAVDTSDDEDESCPNSFGDSYAKLRTYAKTESKKKLLQDLIGPVEEQPPAPPPSSVSSALPSSSGGGGGVSSSSSKGKQQGGAGGGGNSKKKSNRRARRQTVATPSWGERTHIPKELIFGVLQADSATGEGAGSSAAYLAHEYGGMALPRRFGVRNQNNKARKSMRDFARAVSGANIFVSQVKRAVNVGKDELQYAPREFTRLELTERKRLAKLLTWKGLKKWGFDAFEVERLSSVSIYRKGMSTKKLSVGNDIAETSTVSFEDDDVVESSRHGCPMVILGWAILASPYSQFAMAKNVEDSELEDVAFQAIKQRANTNKGQMSQRIVIHEEEDGDGEGGGNGNGKCGDSGKNGNNAQCANSNGKCEEGNSSSSANVDATAKGEARSKESDGKNISDAWSGGYFLPDEFEISPRAVCRFLRKVEKEYSPRQVNPYHNNVHAADVMQSTHALIQMGGLDMMLAYSSLEIYSILLAAALHDVRHPGTNNNYQVNKMTELSLTYNDVSVLENMHASRASYLVEGLEDKNEGGCVNTTNNNTTNGGGAGGEVSGILGRMSKEQHKMTRSSIIKSILYTDMSRHFSEVAKMKRHVEALEEVLVNEKHHQSSSSSLCSDTSKGKNISSQFLKKIGGEKHVKLREKFLPFLLHMADISNPTKPHDVSVEWANCVYDEFFLQGDKEAAEDMPISPLCDRSKTNRPEAQVGFMTFVIKPAFELLSRCLPGVENVVLTQLDKNLDYWKEEKAKMMEEKEMGKS
eukprot:CAMPEP_0183718610 /NCGR_PEP_ID=MMETSP0737-20130205/11823_1 /TAXON_ID=385413 /ORGANISM="Thalassiosira miniscula, Strain CCMP1093" /LENGTH=1076 /DNA_ID=CAMNT_0025948201 /DNA_START=113 /DNA_END=3343 /DNA_ORIENTATION=+